VKRLSFAKGEFIISEGHTCVSRTFHCLSNFFFAPVPIFFHAKPTLELCHEANSDIGGTEEQPTMQVAHVVVCFHRTTYVSLHVQPLIPYPNARVLRPN
jgi:hypothetical protein